VIFAAIAIAWLAYLVPHFVRRGSDANAADTDPADRFSENLHIVRSGSAPLLDQDLEPIEEYEVSTPLTRRAAIADLRRLDRVAAARRRRVLLALLAVISVLVGVCAVGWLPWWSVAIPGGMLVAFFAVSRVSVHLMRKRLDLRYEAIVSGGHEKTVFLGRRTADQTAGEKPVAPPADDAGTKPVAGTLWDPVPITMPTYVSKPLAPRTVRTIDLSGPDVSSAARQSHPVTADAPEPSELESSPAPSSLDQSPFAPSAAGETDGGDEDGGSREIASA
jgi:hypothetical protein